MKIMSRIKRSKKIDSFRASILLLVALSTLCLSACVVQRPAEPNDPYYAPVLRTNPQADTPLNGSLYQPNAAITLFFDGKASRIGDIITVVLQERTSSSKSSNVAIKKDNDIGVSTDAATGTLFGTVPGIGNLGLGTGLNGEREFKGEADADQSNRLTGSISVTVVDVYPNGTLVIRGEKWITLNRGNEFIRISGLIRSDDISPENSIDSTKIANARITYSGTGDIADSSEMGWLSRFFNSAIWPF
ncbi:MAG: flagellar L-ring protein precursor FlgH [Lentisphaeria bacterium]